MDLNILSQALQIRAVFSITKAAELIEKSHAPAKVKDNELFAQAKVTMTKYHMNYLSLYLYIEFVENRGLKDQKLKEHLLTLGKIYALN